MSRTERCWSGYNTDSPECSRNERFAIELIVDRLAQLGLWTLEERRHCAGLLEVFRMYKGLSLTPFSQFFTLSPVNNTRGHSAKIQKNHCSLDTRQHFFSQKVVNRWNCLPQHVIDSASINIFKNGLHKMRRDSMGFFMDWLVRLALQPHMFWGFSEQVRPHLVSYLLTYWERK